MRACLSSSVSSCCAHKLSGVQVVTSASAMTHLAIGLIGSLISRAFNPFMQHENGGVGNAQKAVAETAGGKI